MRRNIIDYCRGLKLQTEKQRDKRRVFCHDLSIQNANYLHALNGYLGITVRQYYVVKHQRKLKHSYLPCIIEQGGMMKGRRRRHQSYYPMEVLVVELRILKDKKLKEKKY